MIAMHKNRYFPDVIGLLVLVILVAILSAFVPASEIPPSLWVPICAAWAVSAIFMWRKVGAGNETLALDRIVFSRWRSRMVRRDPGYQPLDIWDRRGRAF